MQQIRHLSEGFITSRRRPQASRGAQERPGAPRSLQDHPGASRSAGSGSNLEPPLRTCLAAEVLVEEIKAVEAVEVVVMEHSIDSIA